MLLSTLCGSCIPGGSEVFSTVEAQDINDLHSLFLHLIENLHLNLYMR